MMMKRQDMILRTKFPERACHWIMVACFFLVAMSGLSWFFPSLSWMNSVLGTPQLARELHPFLGIVVFVLLMFMCYKFAHHNLFVKTDIIWFRNAKDVLLNKHGEKLQIGKYNAGQKILFWSIMSLISVLLISGLMAWRAYFAGYFPIPVVRLALLCHSLAGIGLILMIIGHIYLAIWVKGSITSMLTGYVSKAWARQHHDRWYDELTAEANNPGKGHEHH
jgi:formate dehydrogenase subunit gamma